MMMIASPSKLAERFERGEIDRDEFQAMMALHQRDLIAEMEQDALNPAAALMEYLQSRRMAGKWARRHGGRLVREILAALADLEDFPLANHLWNAPHPDVPLHCFFRFRREPVFRITEMELSAGRVRLSTEWGSSGKGRATKQEFQLARGTSWKLEVISVAD